MLTWAIVPVSPLRQYDPQSAINDVTVLEQNLRILTQTSQVDHILVISRDPKALAVARACGARTLQESEPYAPPQSLRRAALITLAAGAERLLYLAPFAALTNVDELNHLLELGLEDWSLSLTPCQSGYDLAAAIVNPASALLIDMGPSSLFKLTAQAQQRQMTVNTYVSYDLCLDTRQPDDMRRYAAALASPVGIAR